ncbi:hypothetical protein [Hyphobacterium marinum]|uniref:Uncharacterized protein n=1 Tax=Hyphobacterium marinum TaxID=3116574 RepID=A0ABU7M0N1_9PROT|nr:hypothetical protein [Hyphobacterium sp. Y6023]MEE2566820.1 hypothetical protein [Hyphobacterium sp. Y6023]
MDHGAGFAAMRGNGGKDTADFVADLLENLSTLSREAGLYRSSVLIAAAISVVQLEARHRESQDGSG